MYKMKCKDDSNVCTHLETLMCMQEQLAGMEAGLTDDELITLILGSLPNHAECLSMQSHVNKTCSDQARARCHRHKPT